MNAHIETQTTTNAGDSEGRRDPIVEIVNAVASGELSPELAIKYLKELTLKIIEVWTQEDCHD